MCCKKKAIYILKELKSDDNCVTRTLFFLSNLFYIGGKDG